MFNKESLSSSKYGPIINLNKKDQISKQNVSNISSNTIRYKNYTDYKSFNKSKQQINTSNKENTNNFTTIQTNSNKNNTTNNTSVNKSNISKNYFQYNKNSNINNFLQNSTSVSKNLGIDISLNNVSSRTVTPKQGNEIVERIIQRGKETELRNNIVREVYKKQELSKFTFNPKIQKGSPGQNKNQKARDFDQFLSDQNKYQQIRDQSIEMKKQICELQETQQYTYTPNISEHSKLLASKVIDKQTVQNYDNVLKTDTSFGPNINNSNDQKNVFNRLYNPKNNSRKGSPSQNQKTNRSNNNTNNNDNSDNNLTNNYNRNNSKSNMNSSQISYRLYNDAQNRQEKQKKLEKEHEKLNNSNNKIQIQDKPTSQIHLANQLIRNFQAVLQEGYLDEKGQIISKLNYLQIQNILVSLKFLSENDNINSQNTIQERTQLNNIWQILKGQENNGVHTRNFLAFLLALMGLNFQLPKLNIEEQQQLEKNQNIQNIESNKDLNPNTMSQDMPIPLERDYSSHLEQQQQININQEPIQNLEQASQTPYTVSYSNISSYRYQNQQNNSNGITSEQFFQSPKSINSQNLIQNKNQEKININDNSQIFNFIYDDQLQNIGVFEQGNIIFNNNEIEFLQKHFKSLYTNKLHSSNCNSNNQSRNSFQNNNNICNRSMSKNNLSSEKNYNSMQRSKSALSLIKSPREIQQNEEMAQSYRYKQKQKIMLQEHVNSQNFDGVTLQIKQQQLKQEELQCQKLQQEEEQFKECTFTPKTNKKFNLSLEQKKQQIKTPKQQQKQQENSIQNTPHQVQRSNQLFELSKQNPQYQKINKEQDYIQYEKQSDQYTFEPQLVSQPYYQKINQNFKQKSREITPKGTEKILHRLNYGRQKQQEKDLKLKRGYDQFNTKKKSYSQYSQEKKLQEKINQPDIQRLKNNQVKGNQFIYSQRQNKNYNNNVQNNVYNQNIQRQNFSPNFKNPNTTESNENLYNNNYDQKQQLQLIDNQQKPENIINEVPFNTFGDQDQQNPQNDNQNIYNQKTPQYQQQQAYEQNPQNQEELPLLHVDVNISKDEVQRITIYEGDDLAILTDKFIQKHGLNPSIKQNLVIMLQNQVNSVIQQ